MKGIIQAAIHNNEHHSRLRREKAEAERIAAEAQQRAEPPVPEIVPVAVAAQAAPDPLPGRWRRFVRWLLRGRVAK